MYVQVQEICPSTNDLSFDKSFVNRQIDNDLSFDKWFILSQTDQFVKGQIWVF